MVLVNSRACAFKRDSDAKAARTLRGIGSFDRLLLDPQISHSPLLSTLQARFARFLYGLLHPFHVEFAASKGLI